MTLAELAETLGAVARFRARVFVRLRAWLGGWLGVLRNALLRRKSAVSESPGETSGRTLENVIAQLDALNRETERDFLQIGEKLAEFTQTVNLISSELTALADLISGEHGSRAAEALVAALERSTGMRARAEAGARMLGAMRQQAGRLKETLSGFKISLSTFHIIGVLTRIETAQLGRAGVEFGNLADDVKAMAGNIQGRIESALGTAAQLIAPIESVLQTVSALGDGAARDLPRVIAEVLASLRSFRDMQNRTRDASLRLGARYGAIQEAFNQLIVSIQFHDITRQQVEHVIEALRRLSAESRRDGNTGQDGWDTGAVLAVQSRQLSDAGEKFAASAAALRHSLEQIAAHILEMAGESRSLAGLSEDSRNSFFRDMERGCTAILSGLGVCAGTEAAAQATSGGLAESLGRMDRSLEEIQGIEIQMQWMALNASISADHIGAAGDALAVLAGAMQTLACESGQRSESLAATLGDMSDAATRLSGRDEPALAPGRGDSLEAMRAAAADVHSASERSFAQLAQIAARSARLREDLCATRDSFCVGALFAECIGRARAMLQEMEEGIRSELPRDAAGQPNPGLADFSEHYTMQAERDVHRGVMAAVDVADHPAVAATAPGLPAAEGEEMGENVEFF
jgi:methyl-accepting chemotaxis protein